MHGHHAWSGPYPEPWLARASSWPGMVVYRCLLRNRKQGRGATAGGKATRGHNANAAFGQTDPRLKCRIHTVVVRGSHFSPAPPFMLRDFFCFLLIPRMVLVFSSSRVKGRWSSSSSSSSSSE